MLGGMVDASSSGIDVLFDSAMEAFRNQDFKQALKLFEAIQIQGDDTAALKYNIAVCLYKLGRTPEARTVFASLIDDEGYRWWARYNIALIDQKLGDTEAARDSFREIAVGSNDENIAVLALQQFNALGGTEELVMKKLADNRWKGSLSLGIGYDDNLLDPTDFSNTLQSDKYLEASSFFSKHWGDEASGWRLDGLTYFSRYEDIKQYDISLLSLRANRLFEIADWQLVVGGGYQHLLLDNNEYLGMWSIELAGLYKFDDSRQSVRLAYEFADISSLDAVYNALDGNHRIAGIEYAFRFNPDWQWQLLYHRQYDDRADRKTATTFTSFSAVRNELTSRLQWHSNDWDFVLDASYRDSNYNDDHVFPDGTMERRDDTLFRIGATLTWYMSDQWAAIVEVRLSDNNSTIDLYQYNQIDIMGGITWSF